MKKVHWCSTMMILCNLAMLIAAAESLVAERAATPTAQVHTAAVAASSSRERRKLQQPSREARPKPREEESSTAEWFPFSYRHVWILRIASILCSADVIWLLFLVWSSHREHSRQMQAKEQENLELRQFANRCNRERDRSVTLLAERNQLLVKLVEERDGWRAFANREHQRAQELESWVYVDERDLKGVLKESSHSRH